MTRLSRITLEGFRSIHSATLDLGPLNVLIGANGAGKSNFIAFLQLFKFALSNTLQEYVQTRGPASALLHFGPKLTPALRGTVEFETDAGRNEYQCTLTYAAGDTLVFTHEEARDYARVDAQPKVFPLGVGGHRESVLGMHWDDPTARAVKGFMKALLGNCQVYQFNDTSLESHLRRTPRADDNAHLWENGGNLASFLLRLRGEYPREFREIERTINMVLPWFGDFVLEPQGVGDKQTVPLRWRMAGRPDYDLSVGQLSDGSLRIICLVTLLLQPEGLRPKLCMLDEPELGLHPAAESLIAGLVKSAAATSQVLISTQSATFLDYFSPDDIVVVENEQGRSTFSRQSSEALASWLERYSLGQVWQKDLIGGRP